MSSFIGRDAELTAVTRLLADQRLVTLTGPGGVGKSRLAVETASRNLSRFSNGTWLVDFAPLHEPDLVAEAVAVALGMTLIPSRPPLECLTDFLHDRHILLVLDNCEHLISAIAEAVERLLKAGREVVVLAASREPLRVEGEVVWSVPPLALPPAEPQSKDPRSVFASDAVRLFMERAIAARPQLRMGEDDAVAVAEIVARLDGLPLAIELAAARLSAMGLSDLVSRLEHRLALLGKGSRTAPARHQALAATIEWSYRLLDEDSAKDIAAPVGFRW